VKKWLSMAACAALILAIGCNEAEKESAEGSNVGASSGSSSSENLQASTVKCEMCNMDHKSEDMKEVDGRQYCIDCGCAEKAANPEGGSANDKTKPEGGDKPSEG